MKAEHRKELETNVLADRLGRAVEGLKHAPSRTTMIWLTVIGVAVVGFLTYRWFSLDSEERSSARWLKLDSAIFPDQLDDLVTDPDMKGTKQGRLAQYMEARRLLHDGLRELGTKKSDALEDVRKGTELYEGLLKESAPTPLLQQEALLGVASGSESLGDLDKARRYYQQLADQHGASAYGEQAKQSLKRLNNDAKKKDLAELDKEYGGKGE